MASSSTLRIAPWKVFELLLFINIGLMVISFSLQLYLYNVGTFPGLDTLLLFLNVDSERSIPTYYSSVLLFLCSLTLCYIFSIEHNLKAHFAYDWLGLAIIFLGMSIDEQIAFHEDVGTLIQQMFGFSGALYFAWVIPAGVFVLLFAGAYLKFFSNLSRRIRYLVLFAAVIYVGGALGMEIIGASHFEVYGPNNITYAFLTTIEEGLEMTGTALFLYALIVQTTRLESTASFATLQRRERT